MIIAFKLLIYAFCFYAINSNNFNETKTANQHATTKKQYSDYIRSDTIFTTTVQSLNLSLKFVIGFSTGHCGTTTFSRGQVFQILPTQNIVFLHEEEDVRHTSTKRYRSRYKTSNWSVSDEVHHIQHFYGVQVLRHVRTKLRLNRRLPNTRKLEATVVDLSHSSLYTYRGLVHLALLYPKEIEVHFIRIRRDRVETVLSMSNGDRFFDIDYYYFHPLENKESVVLTLNQSLWDSMTFEQKLFWVVDETEARWQQLLKNFITRHHNLHYSEVFWAQRLKNSFENAVEIIANILHTERADTIFRSRAHAGETRKNNISLLLHLYEEDRAYQHLMNYNYLPG
jgi:hypothetical protein